MGYNKVIVNGVTKVDLTSDTVSPDTMLESTTAHNVAGDLVTGTIPVNPQLSVADGGAVIVPQGYYSGSELIGYLLPTPSANDYDKVPTVNAAGTGYELTGPYAPLSAAIIETAKGNPAVCEDSVEWGLQGMRVYGKSTQVSTTGAQLFDKSTVTADQWFAVDTGEIENAVGYSNSDYIPVSPGNYISGQKGSDRTVLYNAEKVFVRYVAWSGGIPLTVNDGEAFVRFTIRTGDGNSYIDNLMFTAGSTLQPFEPYTGGKPSPSPEYPQEIHSAGDDGEIDITVITVSRANILNPDWYSSNYQILFETYDLKPGDYTLSFVSTGDWWTGNANRKNWYIAVYDENNDKITPNIELGFTDAEINARSSFSFTLPYGTVRTVCLVYTAGVKAKVTNVMLNAGSTVLPYEPYKIPQSLTFSTSNGLPGIPVTSGGNFVDADGQEWICDYRDWTRGVDVKNIETISAPEIPNINIGQPNEGWQANGNTIPFFYWDYLSLNKPNSVSKYGYCTHYKNIGTSIVGSDIEGYSTENRDYFAFRIQKAKLVEYGYDDADQVGTGPSAFLAWLNAHSDLQIFYIINPVESPIPANELAAYRALHTYDGTTVITPDDTLASLEVDYIVKPKAYIEKKLTAIETRLNALEISEALEGE